MSDFKEKLFQYVPALGALRTYSLATFKRDAFAGCTVAAIAVPQSMAYASIIELPVQYGLYTAIVMTAVGALFDSSKHLINGPTNVISIAMLSALASIPEESRPAAAIMMSLMIGIIQTGITLLRLGDFSRFISHAVIVGFTAGASVLLVMDQLKHVVGWTSRGSPHDHFLKRFYLTATEGGPIHAYTLLVALGTIVVILMLREVNRRFKLGLPEFLLGIAIMGFAVSALGWSGPAGVKLVEAVPRHLPSFMLPTIDFEMASELAGSATAIAFLGLLEAIAMAKSLAAKSGQRLDMNQQCLSEGLANLCGSFFQCFPGSGSLTRSHINHQSGGATQWSGVISAIMVAVTVVALAPYAGYIPKPALAGVLVLTAFRMVDYRGLLYYVRATRFDAVIVFATAFSAVFISIEFCVLIGVVLSFFMYVPRAAKLYVSELTVGENRVVREIRSEDQRCRLYRIYNFEGEMFFGSSTDLENAFDSIVAHLTPDTRVILIRLKRARNPDAVCLKLLDDFIALMHRRAITVLLSGVHEGMRKALENVGVIEKLGQQRVFLESAEIWSSTIDAVRYVYTLLGPKRCEICTQKPNSNNDNDDFHYMI
ncbi:MAG: SulP family inorganic anion transporter [Pirellulaceae bacterium]|nr:SulP family inorganic anion transporter [Pirellulaceae bacterium]